jgi:hypothetical protein
MTVAEHGTERTGIQGMGLDDKDGNAMQILLLRAVRIWIQGIKLKDAITYTKTLDSKDKIGSNVI